MEARFGGKAKYYGATVVKSNEDGTAELKYDDGDVEKAVALSMICTFASAGEFVEGQRVEARFGGKNKFYAGNIVKDNGDGTYAIKYADGDVETSVKFIRALESEAVSASAGESESSPTRLTSAS